ADGEDQVRAPVVEGAAARPSPRSDQPMRKSITPSTAASAATPKATTEVNSEARRHDVCIAVSRSGVSRCSSACGLPRVAARAWLLIVSASEYAVHGELTDWPA